MSRFAAKPQSTYKPAFNFTYSKLKTFENCPSKYNHLYVTKDVVEDDSEHLKKGNAVHAAMAAALEGAPLPENLKAYQKWIDKVLASVEGTDQLLVEQKLGIDENFQVTGFFDKNVWLRGIVDATLVKGDHGLIVDWKTGKPQDDIIQLALQAALIFPLYPDLQEVVAQFVWLEHDMTSTEHFKRSDMVELWSSMVPRVTQMKYSQDIMEFPAKQNALCKFCPVRQCAHNKKA